jgi:hypothetical protein
MSATPPTKPLHDPIAPPDPPQSLGGRLAGGEDCPGVKHTGGYATWASPLRTVWRTSKPSNCGCPR